LQRLSHLQGNIAPALDWDCCCIESLRFEFLGYEFI
jgi:hypothetical protein